jgi:hypothetical protein
MRPSVTSVCGLPPDPGRLLFAALQRLAWYDKLLNIVNMFWQFVTYLHCDATSTNSFYELVS